MLLIASSRAGPLACGSKEDYPYFYADFCRAGKNPHRKEHMYRSAEG
jgi:hypothetical protein